MTIHTPASPAFVRAGSLPDSIKVEPLTCAIGAELINVNLGAASRDAGLTAEIRALLLKHRVLFFRDQDITPEQQLAFARQMGPVSIPPFVPKYGTDPELVVLDQVSPKGEGADEWHSDNTFMAEPPMGSILKAVQLPTYGGDTCFASMHAAYDALSEAMKLTV